MKRKQDQMATTSFRLSHQMLSDLRRAAVLESSRRRTPVAVGDLIRAGCEIIIKRAVTPGDIPGFVKVHETKL